MGLQRWSPGSVQGPGDAAEAWAREGALAKCEGLSMLMGMKGLQGKGHR